jgi:sugar lactone lactonase YvrE
MKQLLSTSIRLVLVFVVLAIGASTANGAPGDLFTTDNLDGMIYKFAPDGTRSTFATGLNYPEGLAFDSEGYLLVADDGTGVGDGTIYKFAPDGTRSIFATGLNYPFGLACDSAGNLFESDLVSGTIYKFAPDGTRSIFVTGLSLPQGLAFDSAGDLFEADFGSNTIYRFAPDGTRSTFATGLNGPEGLAFDSAGYLFATDIAGPTYGGGRIYKFAPDGTRSTLATELTDPEGMAFDSAGNLFEADYGSNTIYKFAPDGTQSTFATGVSHPIFLAIQPPAATPSYATQIQPPINPNGTSVFSARHEVVPVKFTLTESGVATCDLPPATIAVTRTGGGVIGEINESLYSGNADTGSDFRIDNCQYVYNLNSRSLGVGIYRVDILINGQVVGSAVFQLE